MTNLIIMSNITESEALTVMNCLTDLFIPKEIIKERLFWLSKTKLPYVHCDDLSKAKEILGLTEEKSLSVEDAELLMNAIDKHFICNYTRIAYEKVIVIRTWAYWCLKTHLFPVGLCYHGRGGLLPTKKEQIPAFIKEQRDFTKTRVQPTEQLTGGGAT
jgi:hypothetical protein